MYLLCNYHSRSLFIPSLTLFFVVVVFFSIAHKLPNMVDKGLFVCFVPHQNGNMTRAENWPLLHQGLLQRSGVLLSTFRGYTEYLLPEATDQRAYVMVSGGIR